MSAIVTQLSYNISEKLHLDDHSFPFTQHHSSEYQSHPANKTTSFSHKESFGPCTSSTACGSSSFISKNCETPSTSTETLFGPEGSVVGVACQTFPLCRTSAFPQRELKNFNFTRNDEIKQTTMYDLREGTLLKCPEHVTHQNNAEKLSANIMLQSGSAEKVCKQSASAHDKEQLDCFPSIVGHGCVLHYPKQTNVASSGVFTDMPATKRHCRSVSEPDSLHLPTSPTRLCQSLSPGTRSWKSSSQSKVWVPFRQLRKSSRRPYSASTASGHGRSFGDCSKSLDFGSLHVGKIRNKNSPLTPPASPVPRPASVTVIKHEGGAWSFLSSRHTSSKHYQKSSFSPLSFPCLSKVSSSSRSHELGSRLESHTLGLCATKRSLSFSDDFEHRESIQYTPSSTPELERRLDLQLSPRCGSLPRCQSHPSDLNLRKLKSKRPYSSKSCHNRPALDFSKMKQTSLNKRSRCKDRGFGLQHSFACTSSWPPALSSNNETQTVSSLFPAISAIEDPSKSVLKLQPTVSDSSSNTIFSVPETSIFGDIGHKMPYRTNATPVDATDPKCESDVGTASGGIVSSFVRDCGDLDINDIENETDDETNS